MAHSHHHHEKSALVLVSHGSEELETISVVDILRRGSVKTHLMSVEVPSNEPFVKCANGVKLIPDGRLEDLKKDSAEAYDMIVLPGGSKGADTFAESQLVRDLISHYFKQNKIIAAICAAPIAFKAANVAKGYRLTSYRTYQDNLADFYDYDDESAVVVDRNVITSRGPGTALSFGLKLVEQLNGAEKANTISTGIHFK